MSKQPTQYLSACRSRQMANVGGYRSHFWCFTKINLILLLYSEHILRIMYNNKVANQKRDGRNLRDCIFSGFGSIHLKQHCRVFLSLLLILHKKLTRYTVWNLWKSLFFRSPYYDHVATYTGVKRHACLICDICLRTNVGPTLNTHLIRFHPDAAANILWTSTAIFLDRNYY